MSLICLTMALAKVAGPLGGDTWWMGEAVWWLLAKPESRLVDLTGLLNPNQRREAWTIGVTGVILILVAFAARILFVVLGKLEGFWKVPLWFDVLIGVMILVGVLAAAWGMRQLIRHLKALRRRD